jgi:hypothetical protein
MTFISVFRGMAGFQTAQNQNFLLFCSSQHSRQAFIILNSVIERMESLEQTLNGMKLKLDASDKGVFNPLAVSVAQSEGGADKDPLNKLNE